ncbi:penicillin-binding protein 2 [Lacrimispora sp. NSJ-141]|uniref:Penicillin-binding protein 2 n=1 Tax=Lientehia hominis TaxID=2897778 RepID=A0AAP2RF88_9FIRM|nr:penicillin-binding transpeptidase domain-containing protein [Lientehia hominis]MCD2491147.1 penicillin-binding protein 2 [Lientehia hominis]
MEKVQKALESQVKEEEEILQVEERTRKVNREIRLAGVLFVLMFIATIGYFSYYVTAKSKDIINSSYNARLDTFSEKIVRGEILGSSGEVLAKTVEDEEGNETRSYPYENLFAHVVGYSASGKTGLESSANQYLLTSHLNVIDQVNNELSEVKNPADNVVTTLDPYLQQLAYDALGDYKGACVILEPSTGKILAMVSKPDYNPNTISADWESLISEENQDANLLNRATQGLYPPGSTFKLLTTLEYIREYPDTWENYQFDCEGTLPYGDAVMSCYDGHVHGHLNLRLSLANSCNCSFATVGQQLNLDSFHALCNSFLFNTELPLSMEYKESSFVMDGTSGLAERVQTSIGQGRTMISPIHNAMITSAIANGGTMMSPYLIDRVESSDGKIVKQFMPSSYGKLLSASEAETLTDFMVAVVNEGTSPSLQSDSYQVAGKTGSAEFNSNKEDSHAWFVGFAPAENPEIVISIIYENGGLGGSVATKGAKALFEGYFSRKNGQ